MTDLTNLEEYTDAITYDLEHPHWGPEGPFYLEFARQAASPVLELGCGTGRLTIPFAQQGVNMVGLDVAPQMLARARDKAGDLPIRWVEADIRTFQLETQFQLTRRTKLAFRYIFPQEMEALLHYNGLRVLSRYGDWDRGPLTDERGCHVYVCTK